jgi:hypothetical protein
LGDENHLVIVVETYHEFTFIHKNFDFFKFTENTSIYVYDGSEEAHELGIYLSERVSEATGFSPSVNVKTPAHTSTVQLLLNLIPRSSLTVPRGMCLVLRPILLSAKP